MVWEHLPEKVHSFIDTLIFPSNDQIYKHYIIIGSKFLSCNLDFVTEVYVKSTNIHQYVDNFTCHPKKYKKLAFLSVPPYLEKDL